MAGVRNKSKPNGKYQAWFTDYTGKRTFFMGTKKKLQTRRMADDLESQHRQIRMGTAQPKLSSTIHDDEAFREIADKYLTWGKSQGGRGGRKWGKTHAKERTSKLSWWEHRLNLKSMNDLYGTLTEVETALTELQSGGFNGKRNGVSAKTLKNYAECLKTFCKWAEKRDYLNCNPLKDLVTFEGTPESTRRALLPEEIVNLLSVAPQHRSLLYEVALMTGLRAGELRSLSLESIDLKKSVLILKASWTKNRKASLQPIPRRLAQKLLEYGKNGEAKKLYDKHYNRKDVNAYNIPEHPLLFISSQPARELYKDLEAASIPKFIPEEGKVDFHSLRVTYVTNIAYAGASVKELQTLARHSNPNLTMNVYAKTRTDQIATVVDTMALKVLEKRNRAHSVHKDKKQKKEKLDNLLPFNKIHITKEWWRRRDSNPRPVTGTRQTLHA